MNDYANLEGLIPDAVGRVLNSYAQGKEVVVEIGSYKGKSTCYLADAAEHVWAIDPWGLPGNVPGRFRFDLARDDFDRQIALMGLEDKVTAIQGFSTEVAKTWDKPIDLLYLDGSHLYADVLADLRAWSPHVVGVIICDDFGTARNPGVAQAVGQFCREYNKSYNLEAVRLAVIK